MNIFALSNDPREAAIWQHDRHVVKMTLETAQLLSTAVWHDTTIQAHWTACHGPFRADIDNIDSGSIRLYKSISNPNHPCAVWTRATLPNFVWTWLHGMALVGEYHRRFQKLHGCYTVFASFFPVVEQITSIDRIQVTEREEVSPGKWHKSVSIHPAVTDFANNHTAFAICMPDEYQEQPIQGKLPSYRAISSYQRLYVESKIFQSHVKWTRCDSLPQFITQYAIVEPQLFTREAKRVRELMEAHTSGIAAAKVAHPTVTHPDLLKPANPAAIRRFGVK